MQLRYSPDTDMMYVAFRDASSVESKEVSAGVVMDYADDGTPVGIEVEDASTRADLTSFQTFSIPDMKTPA